jgi:hypothetical protein
MTPKDNALCMQAKTVGGETLTFNAFKSELLKTDDNHILYFQMAEFSLIDEITLKLPGKVKFVSVLKNTETDEELGGIEVNGSTVTLTPVSLNYSKTVKNEQNENETVTYQLDSIFGYVVYEKGVSGWAIAGIVIGVLALGAFVWFGIVKGGVKRFFKGDVWRRMKRYKALYLLLLPAFVLLILFRYMPMVWLSAGFMEYNLLNGLSSEWVGLKCSDGVNPLAIGYMLMLPQFKETYRRLMSGKQHPRFDIKELLELEVDVNPSSAKPEDINAILERINDLERQITNARLSIDDLYL